MIFTGTRRFPRLRTSVPPIPPFLPIAIERQVTDFRRLKVCGKMQPVAARRRVKSYLEGSVPLPWYSVPLGTEALGALADAEKEARAFGHREVETCHLLLALVKTSDTGFAVLKQLEVTEDAVRAEIEHIHRSEEPEPDGDLAEVGIADGGLCVSLRIKEVIDEAQGEAYTYGHRHATPTDLLLALTRARAGCTSNKVFNQLGLPITFVHSQVVRRIRHIDDVMKRRLPGELGHPA